MDNKGRPDNETLLGLYHTLGTKVAVAAHLGKPESTIRRWLKEIDNAEAKTQSEVEALITPSKGRYKEHPIILTKTHRFDIKKLYEEAGLDKNQSYKMVVIPDFHFPDHDPNVLKGLKQFLRDYKPHGFGSIGDFWDMKEMSHWENNADFDKAADCILAGHKIMGSLVEAAGDPTFKFITLGNHEVWIDQTLSSRISGLRSGMKKLGYGDVDSQNMCGMHQLGFTALPYNEIMQIGQANFTHGCYTNDAHAKAHLNVVGSNIFYGHCETVQSYSGTSIRGVHIGQCIGTLRDLSKATFLRNRPTSWVHGFLIIEFQYNGFFTPYVPVIVDGKFSYNGTIYGV
jgi:hypothetical protein